MFFKGALIKLAAGLMATLLLGSLYLFFVRSHVRATEQIDYITASLATHNSLQMIHSERESSIEKVVQIISRYNREMSDSLKLAIANEIYLMTLKYPNLNVNFISATITHESAKTWDPKVTSHVGAMGLMQIMPATGAFLAVDEGIKWTSAEKILYDPIYNIRLGCRYLNQLVGLYEKDGGLAAYNGGPKRAEMWIANNRNNTILWEETRSYVPAVLELYHKFRSEGTL
ncbi:lytic transglycosylase domain-containing protein [candidate division KSB1 bacterium]|nr:MAG: lytic transglycosylase domain-containing protein [candidate division KSB1 bacterium]